MQNSAFEQEVLRLTNEFRQKNGLKPLVIDQSLEKAADQHTQNMALQDFFSHTGKDGSRPWDRAKSAGYESGTVGENIAAGYGTPQDVVTGWINSPGHRANLLNTNYNEIGLGHYFLQNDTGSVNYNHYWTQVFGKGTIESSPMPAPTPAPAPVPAPAPAPSGSRPIRYEAEALTLDGLRIETIKGSGASAGKHIKGGTRDFGTASGVFDGPAGTYRVKVGLFDENDGQSSAIVTVKGRKARFMFDRDLPSGTAKPASRTDRVTHQEISLRPGDRFQIQGKGDRKELARFDYIEFVPVKSTSSNVTQTFALQADPVNLADSISGNGVDLPQTHFNTCACSTCCSQDFSSDGTELEADFQTFGSSLKWQQPSGKGSPITITYSYTDLLDGGIVGDLSNTDLKAAIQESFELWADYSPLNFVEVKDSGEKSRSNLNAADIRIGHDFLGGRGGTLGRTNLTTASGELATTINFDNADQWTFDASGSKFDFLEVAVHEIGHALGLNHEVGKPAIMNTSIQNRYSGLGTAFLLQDDIDGIRFLYGSGKGSVKPLGGQSSPSPAPTPAPAPVPSSTPAPVSSVRYEAEQLSLSGFQIESAANSGASGGKQIAIKGGGGKSGTATGVFNGSSGTYQVKVGYFDENDGQSSATVTVNGKATSFKFDRDLSSSLANSKTLTNRVTHNTIDLKSGDRFQISAQANRQELARFDYIEFSPLTGSKPAGASDSPPSNNSAESLNLGNLQSYGGSSQDVNAKVTLSSDQTAVKLEGNGWKKLAIAYEVTPETMLQVQFRNSLEGEIHAIGFDTNNRIGNGEQSRTFQLTGTQTFGNQDFNDDVTQSGWKTYQIPVGEYFTGMVDYLTFANDHDVKDPVAVGEFRNIKLYEATAGIKDASAVTADVFTPSDAGSIVASAIAGESIHTPGLA
jgi:hypothetical protein